jgi:hypothetical protein
VCPKVRHLQYKVRRLQYKISEIQVFAGAALYLYLPENILQMPEFSVKLLLFCAVRAFDLLRTGYGCSFLVASNVFVRTNLIY